MSWPTNYDRLASATMFSFFGLSFFVTYFVQRTWIRWGWHTQYTHTHTPQATQHPSIFIACFFFFDGCWVFRCVSCLPLEKFWLPGLFWAGDQVAPGIKDELQGSSKLSPGETNASHVIQENDFRFSVSSNIWTGLLKWLKGPLIRQILGKEILHLHELAVSRHILTLTSLVSRESFFDRNPWPLTMSIMPPVRRRHELPLKVKEGVPLRRLHRMTGWFKLTQQDDAMVQCNS